MPLTFVVWATTVVKARRYSHQNGNSIQELLLYKISRDTLAKISDAKQVSFKVGKYSGQVEKTHQF